MVPFAHAQCTFLAFTCLDSISTWFRLLMRSTYHELEDEGERVARVDDVVQRHDVRVLQALQQGGCKTQRYRM